MCDSESESESEGEEMELPNDNDEDLLDTVASKEITEGGDNRPEHNNEDDSNSLLPVETLDRKESVEIWKSRNETDVIVSDHDVFGTHENDEDSMDSLVLREDTIDDGDDSTMSSDLLSSLHYDEGQEGSLRPKRKSGSLSELTLPGSLPLKKQRPESLMCHPESGLGLLETPDSATDPHRPSVLMITNEDNTVTEVHCDTAPTSPRTPPPSSSGSASMFSLISERKTQGRSLIPDKENPPQDILDWVSTFSRWSHAERLLAINQLIDGCEPQQVRHMMQVGS